MEMIDEHHRLMNHKGLDGNSDVSWLAIDVDHLETGMAYALSNRCPRVSFSSGANAKGKGRLDLNVLKELPFLEGLDVACDIKKPIDLSPLYTLGNLEDLWLRTLLPTVDLQHFGRLRRVLLGSNRFSGGRFLKRLRWVRVVDYSNDLADELAAIPNLQEIEFFGCKAEYLEGFDRYPSIRSVTLRYPQKLARLDEIAASATLRDFGLERSSLLSDLSVLGKSKSIENVWILQKEIASCQFVRVMKNLRDFTCNASISDNDIQPILDSKSLRAASLNPMKKSYMPKITSTELDKFFARKKS